MEYPVSKKKHKLSEVCVGSIGWGGYAFSNNKYFKAHVVFSSAAFV